MPRSNKLEMRQRSAAESDLSLRDAGGDPTFFGHAAVVNTRTSIGNPLTWGFFEEIDARAFDRTLTVADPRFLVDHDTSKIVSRKTSGDLRLSLDPDLVVDSDLDQEVSYVKDLARNVNKRRITGMSFGFVVTKDAWSTVDIESVDDKGKTFTTQADLRRILDLDLWEVSAVTFPAYEETDAALRAIQLSPWAMDKRRDMVTKTTRVNTRTIGRALDLMTELRAGKTLSAANIAVLQGILDNVSSAQTDLTNLLGDDPEVKCGGCGAVCCAACGMCGSCAVCPTCVDCGCPDCCATCGACACPACCAVCVSLVAGCCAGAASCGSCADCPDCCSCSCPACCAACPTCSACACPACVAANTDVGGDMGRSASGLFVPTAEYMRSLGMRSGQRP